MPDRLFVRMLTGDDLVVEAPVPIDWRGRSARALFALLALHPGEPVSRDRLAGLLWPNSDQQAARASLRMALLGLRRALDPVDPELIQVTNESIALDLDRSAVDWAQFEALAGASDTSSRLEALDLYRGDLAAAFPGPHEGAAEVLRDLRERLRDLAITTGAGLVADLEQGDAREQIRPVVQKILAIDPANEPARRTMMEAAATAGDRPAVLRQYEQCRKALQEHYGLEPSAETVALRDRLVGTMSDRQDEPGAARAGRLAAAGPGESPVAAPKPPSGRSGWRKLLAAAIIMAGMAAAVFALILPRPDPPPLPVVAVSVHFDPAESGAEEVSDQIVRAFDRSLRRIPDLVVLFTTAPTAALPDPLAESFIIDAFVGSLAETLRIQIHLRDTRPGARPWMDRFEFNAGDSDNLGPALERELERSLIPELSDRIAAASGPDAPPN